MKIICILSVLLFSSICGHAFDQYVEYHVENNRYVIVYVEHEEMTPDVAKQYALVRAAEIASQNGCRYFTIDLEEQVQVAQTQRPAHKFHNNLYQELIIEHDFGKQSLLSRPGLQPTKLFPGFKLTISCYEEKPSGQATLDTQHILSCE